MKSNDSGLIQVALIIAPHGLTGEVSAKSLSDNPCRFQPGALLKTADGGVFRVESSRAHKGRLLLKLADINSREQAEHLRGIKLFVEEHEAPPLPEGEYYHFQLIGLEVQEAGLRLGEISDILSYPANDIYVLALDSGGEALLPALKTVVRRVDVAAGFVEVDLPKGLLDAP